MEDTNETAPDSLERQVERGSLYTHTVLGKHAERINEIESFLYGFIDLMLQKGTVDQNELQQAADGIRKEMYQKGEHAHAGVGIRVDEPDKEQEFVPVNCEERMPVCQAICCKLNFALSVPEIESGKVKWDLGKPYFIRHECSGYCSHLDGEKKSCGIYHDRPQVCKTYSCAGDTRIWKDFDAMLLNEEWINTHLTDQGHPMLQNGLFIHTSPATE